MNWKVTTKPATEPVTLKELKQHCRIDTDDDDDLMIDYIRAAREFCETYQARSYVTQTITAKLDRFCNEITLPAPPLISVTSVSYTDTAGDSQTVSSSVYDVDTTSEPGRITIAYNQTWPTDVRLVTNAITIVYQAGYGAPSEVPDRMKQAIKFLAAHYYEHREPVVMGVLPRNVPRAMNSLLSMDRML